MNLSQTAKSLAWVASHPERKAHPVKFPLRVLRWEWCRMTGTPVRLPLFDFVIQARPSDGVGRLICYFGDRADKLFAFMKGYLKPGMTFVDVGANIGSHTLHGARLVADTGRVFSFEADPETFSLLKENVRLNCVGNAVLWNQCLSNKSGTVIFNRNANSARSSLLHPGDSQMTLSASALDDLLPLGQPIDLLKIDVEGADYLVLDGARRIFANAPPRVVVIEVTSCSGEIKDFLLSHAYRFYRFDESRSALIEVESPVFETYAVHDRARQELSTLEIIPLVDNAPSTNLTGQRLTSPASARPA
jgi:FkbM family methyltransferase